MSIFQIIFGYFTGFFEALCLSYVINVCFNILIRNTNKISIPKTLLLWIYISMFSIIAKTSNILYPSISWIKPLAFLVITTVAVLFVFKTTIFKSSIVAVSATILTAVMELVLVLILKCMNINPYDAFNSPLFSNLFGASNTLVCALLAFIAFKLFKIFNRDLSTVNNKLKYFMPQLIAIVICMIPSMILLIVNYYKYSFMFLVINLFQLLVLTFVGIYNLKFVQKHENAEVELANTITYNETLKKVNEGVRGFKHDMGNIVQAILGYIAVNDAEGAKKYCQNLVIGFNDINVLSILSPKVIDDPAIYGVVVNKILIARDKNMTLSLDVNLNVSEINFPKFELSRILGILIDNAIEAGETTEDKKLIVNMYHDFKRDSDIIIISNSIENTNIDVNKIFEKNYSTKENPSGFGLYEVNKFLKYNPQAYISTHIDKNSRLFTQMLTIASNSKNINKFKESTVA